MKQETIDLIAEKLREAWEEIKDAPYNYEIVRDPWGAVRLKCIKSPNPGDIGKVS